RERKVFALQHFFPRPPTLRRQQQQQQQQQQQERINAGPEVSTFPDAGPERSTAASRFLRFGRPSLGFVQGPWRGPNPPAGEGPQGPEKAKGGGFVRPEKAEEDLNGVDQLLARTYAHFNQGLLRQRPRRRLCAVRLWTTSLLCDCGRTDGRTDGVVIGRSTERAGGQGSQDAMDKNTSGTKRKHNPQLDSVFLYEGGKIAWERQREITRVLVGPQVKDITRHAFRGCINLAEVQFDEGSSEAIGEIGEHSFHGCKALQVVVISRAAIKLGACAFYGCVNLAEVKLHEGLEIIGEYVFHGCRLLQEVAIPSSVTKLGDGAFFGCGNLASVQFGEGLEIIGECAFGQCTALRSVTVPSSVTKLKHGAFSDCTNLTEVILLGGERLLNRGFFDRGLLDGERALNKNALNEMIGDGDVLRDDCPLTTYAFLRCPLTTLKISIPRALSERIERLPGECRLSIEQRVHDLRRLELTQDGNILACFPLIRGPSNFYSVEVTNDETAESLHQVLRLICFHVLKESSILVELAMWKSRLDEDLARADCRTSVPDPAKSLIMEFCGFTDFLEPAIEGA
ncbi:hypothetical protein THAOC_04959, partial [Thalassiosira oceanica]